ncbi:hypothetical protein [uncultured Oscillibacter sp.]|uniref:hypothetical protein n=1 Tax=uncultured Oscillibacter sp. TaxID=876091 RepID=UPI0027297AEF|nr:hypothetical protein [uncultured Oscillibacter sp.]
MSQQKKHPGNAQAKRNSWFRGKGKNTFCGELKHGIALRKKELNHKVRHTKGILNHGQYKRIKRTVKMVNFS